MVRARILLASEAKTAFFFGQAMEIPPGSLCAHAAEQALEREISGS